VHSAIFVAVIPPQVTDWNTFLTNVHQKSARFPEVRRIAGNVWLIDLQTSMSFLGYLIAAADNFGISAGTLPLPNAPQWLPAGFDPTPIPGRSGHP
jgi:hypothetical protein